MKLTPQEQTRLSNTHTPNPESYDAYLEGRYFLQKMNGPTPDRAQQYFEAAIQKDPAWALPYSGLAEVDMVSGANAPLPNDECKQAKELAMQSLRLDSTAAENHTVLADVEFFCEWNWVDAEKEAGRAIELNPNYARARSSRARYLLAMDRTEEALNESKRAVELDPLSFRVRLDRWTLLFVTAHYPEALQQCRSIQELELNKDLGQVYCGDVDIQQGKFAEGIQELERAVTMSQTPNPRAIAHLGFAYAVAGRRRDAENELAQLESMMKRRHVHPDLLAGVYAGLGQREQAFNWLEKAYEVRARDLLELKYDPRFASLHPDPRFNDLLRRIGVAKDSSYHK